MHGVDSDLSGASFLSEIKIKVAMFSAICIKYFPFSRHPQVCLPR